MRINSKIVSPATWRGKGGLEKKISMLGGEWGTGDYIQPRAGTHMDRQRHI